MSLSSRASGGAFSPAVILVVLLVGVVSLAGIGLLSAYAPELKSGDDGGTHALSKSAVGFGGLPILLRNLGAPVVLNRGVLTEASDESLLVLTPRLDTKPEQIEDIAHYGATLIVLPKWNAAPDSDHPGWVRTVGLIPAEAALSPLDADLRKESRLNTRQDKARLVLRRPNGETLGGPVDTTQLRTLDGPNWIPVVVDDQGRSVLAMDKNSRIYVLADPDLISNGGLKTLAGARTARDLIEIVRPDGAPVVFDLTLNGFQRSRNLLRLMLEPPLLGLTLVLAALAAVAGFQAAVRFGAPKDRNRVIALGKRGLADNTAGLVRLARREPQMALPYAQIMRATVARAIGAPRALDDAALDAFLDRVGRTVGAQDAYTALADRAKAAKTPGDLMKVAAALYRWNQEMTRGRQ